jgi:hypothetical protein
MSIQVVMMIIGAVLLLIAIVGGGFELKELKIPRVTMAPRLLAGIAGIVFICLGIGIASVEKNPLLSPGPSSIAARPDSASPCDFTIRDELDTGQASEQVTLQIDGKTVGTLTVNQQYPTAMLRWNVERPGQYSYYVDALAVFEDGNEYSGVGQGMINVAQGKGFALQGSFSGNTWLVTLTED